jgi:hypothetical protein
MFAGSSLAIGARLSLTEILKIVLVLLCQPWGFEPAFPYFDNVVGH